MNIIEFPAAAERAADRKRMRVCLAALAGVLLLVAAWCVCSSLLQGREGVSAPVTDPGTDPAYACSESGLAVASRERIALYSSSGHLLGEDTPGYDSPGCAGGQTLSVYYGAGERGFRVIRSTGRVQTVDTENAVSFIDVNEEGFLCVISGNASYLGTVTVYSEDLTPLFRWDAASETPVAARMYDELTLAVLCRGETGGSLRFFRIDSDEEQASCRVNRETPLDFGFLSDGTAALLTDRELRLIDSTGDLRAQRTLSADPSVWSLSGSAAVVGTSDTTVTVYSPAGDILAAQTMGAEVLSAAQYGERVLLRFPSEVMLSSLALDECVYCQVSADVRSVFLSSERTALLCGSDGVLRIDFGR